MVVGHNAFSTLEALQSDLPVAFESPQDESRVRAEFFSLRQGRCPCATTFRSHDIWRHASQLSQSTWPLKSTA
ncbi:hypothetical protein GQ600_11954 [Phytophthora cactorum]|nr:hypothetical protein GQ600_11954 [Phytophthora cactorum]